MKGNTRKGICFIIKIFGQMLVMVVMIVMQGGFYIINLIKTNICEGKYFYCSL